MASKFEKYKTEKSQPKCVQYWDRQFAPLKLWFDWLICKSAAESNLEEVKELFDYNEKEAYALIWNAFISACHCTEDDDNPMEKPYEALILSITPEEFPLFMCHLAVGSNINDGHSESDAANLYKEWLLEEL